MSLVRDDRFTCADCMEEFEELELFSITINNTGVETDIFLCDKCAEGNRQ